MIDRVTRFGVSLPSRVVEKFDKIILDLEYPNRSKAINDAVLEFITQKNMEAEQGKVIGSISYIYNHHTGDVTHKLTELQHDYSKSIKSVMHSHISHDECVEVLIVSGKTQKIKELFGKISATKGVENCKLAILIAKHT